MSAFVVESAVRVQPATLRRFAQGLELFKRYVADKDAGVDAVTRAALLGFHGWLVNPKTARHGGGRAPETVRKIVGIVESFWRWLADHDSYVDHVVRPRSLKLPTTAPPPSRAPTWAEADAAIVACRSEMSRRAMIVERFTGLRAAQVLALRVEDLDMKARTLVVRSGKTAQEKRGRIIPVSRHLVEMVRTWTLAAGPLVNDKRVRQARDRSVRLAWLDAGVREVVWRRRHNHAMRKCFLSELKRAGADVEAVEYLVGHSRGLRGVYVEADALPLREAVDLIPPLTLPSVVALPTRKASR